jgi:hypothetical protein
MANIRKQSNGLPVNSGDMAYFNNQACVSDNIQARQEEAFKNFGVVALDSVNMSPIKGVLKNVNTVTGSSKAVSFTYDMTDVGIVANTTVLIGLPLAMSADSNAVYSTVYGTAKINALVTDNLGANVPATRRFSDSIAFSPVTIRRIYIQSSNATQLAQDMSIVRLLPDGKIRKTSIDVSTAVDASFNQADARQRENYDGLLTIGGNQYIEYPLIDGAVVTVNFYLESAVQIEAFSAIK